MEVTVFNYNSSGTSTFQTWNHISGTSSGRFLCPFGPETTGTILEPLPELSHAIPDLEALQALEVL